MLSTSVGVFAPSSLGGGQYSLQLYVNPSSKAKYLNAGDYIQDSTGNEYEVVSFTSPHSDGGTVTVDFVTADVIPVQDGGYNSLWYTPGQVDLRPEMQTAGGLGSPVLYSGPNYEYSVFASWAVSSQANEAVVGDRIVDANGREFEISFLDPTNRFNVDIRVIEVEKNAQPPVSGSATMYRPTSNRKLFQGTELTTSARTAIRNRDNAIVDQITSGSSGGGGALLKEMENGSGSTIASGKAVAKLADGTIAPADSDGVNRQQMIGLTAEEIIDGATGNVYLFGQNVPGLLTGSGFNVGEEIYLAETEGQLTNDPNSFTGDNDSIIKVGIADCASGSASSVVADLIMFPEVIIRP